MANIGLNRQQLAQFLPNHEAIKAFEQLFQSVGQTLPATLDDVQLSADNAQLQAAEALARLSDIANALSLALYGAYSENAQPDLFDSVLEQPIQDSYIPPVSLGTMAEQNANKVAITGGSILGANVVAPETHSATSKTPPVDADELPLADSATSFSLKKLTWANLKATLKAYFDTLYSAIAGSASIVTVGALNAGSITNGFGAIDVGTDSITGGSVKAVLTYTDAGSPSIATATPTTIFAVSLGRYEIMAMIVFSGGVPQYTAFATVMADGSGARIVANNGVNLTLTLSGLNVQITQTSASTQTIYWSMLRIWQ